MILLLPPSETKRDGGDTTRALDLASLGFPQLTPQRRRVLAALASVSRSLASATAALGLGPTQSAEVERNRRIRRSPVMPAIERYTGVLYDALEVSTLDDDARRFAVRSLVIHSALFGLLRADDPVPAYRLSHDSKLPNLSLRAHWRDATARAISEVDGLVIDLRSQPYVALGPRPGSAISIRVVTDVAEPGTGVARRLALSHFNKHAKGEFARAVVASGISHERVGSLLEWARGVGIELGPGASDGELDLVVHSSAKNPAGSIRP